MFDNILQDIAEDYMIFHNNPNWKDKKRIDFDFYSIECFMDPYLVESDTHYYLMKKYKSGDGFGWKVIQAFF